MKVALGGERLGAGKKNNVELHGYSRSTHDLSYVWRSTMASGTLVPFMSEVGLPGDSFDINLNMDIKTHPTIGPLFGSYKAQVDVFVCPIRLYHGALHMNMLGIGMNMSKIKLPTLTLRARQVDVAKNLDNQQINPSCIYSYFNIRGLGVGETGVERTFNGLTTLMYWDIYKQYYSNKQEEHGVVIHNNMKIITENIIDFRWLTRIGGTTVTLAYETGTMQEVNLRSDSMILIEFTDEIEPFSVDRITVLINEKIMPLSEVYETWTWNGASLTGTGLLLTPSMIGNNGEMVVVSIGIYYFNQAAEVGNVEPRLQLFKLKNIDDMRIKCMQWPMEAGAFPILMQGLEPYNLTQAQNGTNFAMESAQEGLGIKTYNSDLFNNWVSTEWIDGDNGINEITKVTVDIDGNKGSFKIDELNMSKKIYDMLNRIAVSGGTYDDWLDVTYTHERVKQVENPIYMGGMMQELVFQEVVSNASSADNFQPLGTLAGRGVLRNKKKGGTVKVRINEPSYIIGIVSLTPRIDYSQGNKWDNNLKTMDDFHKPQLDEIGFQDLITDQMAWWDTEIEYDGQDALPPIFKSAGKQPAWINYMTNVNVTRGNFADQTQQMYMVLNRRYTPEIRGRNVKGIQDLTTYIDPSQFNHIFADTRRDAQNFWTQIAVDITARRKMSAKVMPNL